MTWEDAYALRRVGRGRTPAPEIEKAVREEVARDFKPYDRREMAKCHICRNPDARHCVNKGLANGLTYPEIFRSCAGINSKLPKNARISHHCVRNHARFHFDITSPAQAVYRRMMEKRAAEDEQDWVDGVGSIVTALGFLEVVGQKGFETLMQPETIVPVELGMSAMIKLHDMTQRGSTDRELAELRRKVSLLGAAVRDVIPEELWPSILGRMEELSQGDLPIDAEVEEVEDEGDYDEPFEPDMEPDVDDVLES